MLVVSYMRNSSYTEIYCSNFLQSVEERRSYRDSSGKEEVVVTQLESGTTAPLVPGHGNVLELSIPNDSCNCCVCFSELQVFTKLGLKIMLRLLIYIRKYSLTFSFIAPFKTTI